jgi:hypothetical protein
MINKTPPFADDGENDGLTVYLLCSFSAETDFSGFTIEELFSFEDGLAPLHPHVMYFLL